MTCQKAHEFLERHDVSVHAETDATKDRQDRAAALKLAKSVDKIVVAKGKKIATFNMKKDAPDDATLLGQLLGPTGNLRAPAARVGRTLFVGFNEEAYHDLT
jgi:arsenate reductase-like glutaredoxin family protein